MWYANNNESNQYFDNWNDKWTQQIEIINDLYLMVPSYGRRYCCENKMYHLSWILASVSYHIIRGRIHYLASLRPSINPLYSVEMLISIQNRYVQYYESDSAATSSEMNIDISFSRQYAGYSVTANESGKLMVLRIVRQILQCILLTLSCKIEHILRKMWTYRTLFFV